MSDALVVPVSARTRGQVVAATLPEKVAMVQAMPLFHALPEAAVTALADVASKVCFDQRTPVFMDGDSLLKDDAVYFLYSGEVESFLVNAANTKIRLGAATQGFFGEIALLHDGKRSANVSAVRDTVTLQVHKAPFLNLLTAHPEIMLAMMREMARRLSRTSQDIRLTEVRDVNAIVQGNAGQETDEVQRVAGFFGDVRFLYWVLPACAIWIGLFLFISQGQYFDRAISLLSLLVSLIAIIVTCVVLHSQNRQAEQNKTRNNEETLANLRAELEIRHLHERLNTLSSDLLARLPVSPASVPSPTPAAPHKDDTPK